MSSPSSSRLEQNDATVGLEDGRTPEAPRSSWGELIRHHLVILAIGGLVFFTNLGEARLWDRDEPRNAGCAAEMMARSDWVVPVFNGQLRDAKPVLLYWLIMSAYAVFGVSEFAARFWSATLALGTLLATYHIGRRLFSAPAACWGAVILATCVMFDVAARAATPDSALIFCTAAALLVFVWGSFPRPLDSASRGAASLTAGERHFPKRWLTVALMYGMMGLGVLAKGPIGFLLPTAIIGMFLLIVRLPQRPGTSTVSNREGSHERVTESGKHWLPPVAVATIVAVAAHHWGLPGLVAALLLTLAVMAALGSQVWWTLLQPFEPRHFLRTAWSMRPFTAAGVVLAVAAPWYAWVGFATDGEFLWGFFLKEHFGRASMAMENHAGSPLFYPVAILVGFFPWSVFMAPLLIDSRARLRGTSADSVGMIFVACWVGVVVGAFTLAATKLPSYVTVCYPALALAAGGYFHRWTRDAVASAAVWQRAALVCLGAVGIVMTIGLPLAARRYLPGDEWLGAIGVVPILAAVAGLLALQRRMTHMAAWSVAGGAVVFSVLGFGFVAGQVSRHQQSQVLLDAIEQRNENASIASFGVLESTWVFYAGQPIEELPLGNVEASEARDFVAMHTHPFIITTSRNLPVLTPQLPSDFTVLADVPYFLKKDRLLLIGRADDALDGEPPGGMARTRDAAKQRR